MVVGIYNPYRKTFGGGEQYLFAFAAFFLVQHHSVIYFSEDEKDGQKAQERFGFNLKNLIIRPPFFETTNLPSKLSQSKNLDILLFYSDGSIPLSLAKKNYLIFQFPTPWVTSSLTTRIKLKNITSVIVNSLFTKTFIDRSFGTSSTVVYPSINVDEYVNSAKEKRILSVGRFTKGMNVKRQDILIEAFKKMYDAGIKDWKFSLVGGVLPGDEDEIERLSSMAQGYPISIQSNIDRTLLLSLYSTSQFYWHAAGYGVDETSHPESVEHFGISTVEAMASGCIPLVFPAGGQKEIVKDGDNGFYWHSTDELIQKMKQLLTEKEQLRVISQQAHNGAKRFDRAEFNKQLQKIFT